MFSDDVHLGNHMLLHADSFPKNDIICTKTGIKCLNRLGVSYPHGRPQFNECTVHDKLQQWHNICNCAELSAHSVEDFWTMVSHMVFERFCLLPVVPWWWNACGDAVASAPKGGSMLHLQSPVLPKTWGEMMLVSSLRARMPWLACQTRKWKWRC